MFPYFDNSFTAVLGPIPGTPGMLSELSPISPKRSIILLGGTPHFCSTFLISYIIGSVDFFVGGAYKKTSLPTN